MRLSMLCNKIEMNESACFTQTIEIEINESGCFTKTKARIHILELLLESYIQKKLSSDSVTQIYIEFTNLMAFLPASKP